MPIIYDDYNYLEDLLQFFSRDDVDEIETYYFKLCFDIIFKKYSVEVCYFFLNLSLFIYQIIKKILDYIYD
jgi:hypothetical protein